MLITRYTKIVMVLCLAAFCLLVAFGNITDYETNYLFVQHVMSMDTTYAGNALKYRAITNPTLWQVAYGMIIAAEAATGILYLAGAIRLFQLRNAPAAAFNRGKSLVVAASLLAFLLWFFGFMVVAGEWFAMWQSQTWNGQEPAFRFYLTALAVLIFVVLPDGDLMALKAEPTQDNEKPKEEAPAPRKRSAKSPRRRRTDGTRRRTDKP